MAMRRARVRVGRDSRATRVTTLRVTGDASRAELGSWIFTIVATAEAGGARPMPRSPEPAGRRRPGKVNRNLCPNVERKIHGARRVRHAAVGAKRPLRGRSRDPSSPRARSKRAQLPPRKLLG
jgi:hypothetical protein